MSLWNPYAYTIQGAPVIGIAPASLRVMGQASAKQLNDARAAFTRFCSMVRLAASHNQREQGLLPDGSRYEIAVVGPATYMTLWPASSGGMPEPYVAWTAYVGTSYLPIWDRPVYAFPSSGPPDPGPAPEYPPPPEEDPYQIAHIQSFVQKEPDVIGQVYISDIGYWMDIRRRKSKVVVSTYAYKWNADGDYEEWELSRTEFNGTSTTTPMVDKWGAYQWDRVVLDHFAYNPSSVEAVEDGITWYTTDSLANDKQYMKPLSADYLDVFGVQPVYEIDMDPLNAYDQAMAATASYNANIVAAYEAAMQAWRDGYQPWLDTVYAQWLEAYEAWQAGSTGFYQPALSWRTSARQTQVAAVRAFLLCGVGDRHLTARLLSFPYNVAYRSNPPGSGAGGVIAHGAPTSTTFEGRWPTTLTNAQPHTVVPAKPHAPRFDVDPAFLLRRDFLPTPLFGWTANGSYDQVLQHWLTHGTDAYEVQPFGQMDIRVSYPNGYPENSELIKSEEAGLVVDSDAFVPPGVRLLIVLFEYEVYDTFTHSWLWTPCPNMVLSDSIWISNLGTYTNDPEIIQRKETSAVRACRPWKVVRQSRLGWIEWSQPEVLDFAAQAERPYSGLADQAELFPSAVVVAERLHPGARPTKDQGEEFPFGAKFLWSGDPAKTAEYVGAWATVGVGAPQEQFIAQALQVTNRLK